MSKARAPQLSCDVKVCEDAGEEISLSKEGLQQDDVH